MQQRTPRNRETAGDFHRQAAEARALAATFSDLQTIKDLQNFATALEQGTTQAESPPPVGAATWKARKAS